MLKKLLSTSKTEKSYTIILTKILTTDEILKNRKTTKSS